MSSSYFANRQTNKCQLSHNLVGRGENEQNIWSLTFKSDLLGPPGDINLEKSVHFHSPKHRCLDHEEKHNYELTVYHLQANVRGNHTIMSNPYVQFLSNKENLEFCRLQSSARPLSEEICPWTLPANVSEFPDTSAAAAFYSASKR